MTGGMVPHVCPKCGKTLCRTFKSAEVWHACPSAKGADVKAKPQLPEGEAPAGSDEFVQELARSGYVAVPAAGELADPRLLRNLKSRLYKKAQKAGLRVVFEQVEGDSKLGVRVLEKVA